MTTVAHERLVGQRDLEMARRVLRRETQKLLLKAYKHCFIIFLFPYERKISLQVSYYLSPSFEVSQGKLVN